MKKQMHAKKQVKKEEKQEDAKQEQAFQTTIPEGKWKGTVLVIVLFLGALAFVYTLSNDTFPGVTGNAIAEKYENSKASESFLETLSALDAIDAKYKISLADYKKGYVELKNEPRYPQPFNVADMQKYLEELKNVQAKSPSAALLLDAKKFLVEAELHHKLSYKDYRGDIRLGTRCKFKPYVDETIAEQGKTIDAGNKAMQILSTLQETYPLDFEALGISSKWMGTVRASLVDIEGEMNYNRIEFYNIWNKNCAAEANAAS